MYMRLHPPFGPTTADPVLNWVVDFTLSKYLIAGGQVFPNPEKNTAERSLYHLGPDEMIRLSEKDLMGIFLRQRGSQD